MSSGFDFANSQQFIASSTLSQSASSADRRDYTFTWGANVYKGFGVFVGYYKSNQEFTGPTQTIKFDGALLGAYGSVPVTDNVSVYGNYAYGFLSRETGPTVDSNSTRGNAAEVGFAFAGNKIWMIEPVFQLGFRAQVLNIKVVDEPPLFKSGTSREADVLWGPTFMITAKFN